MQNMNSLEKGSTDAKPAEHLTILLKSFTIHYQTKVIRLDTEFKFPTIFNLLYGYSIYYVPLNGDSDSAWTIDSLG